MPRPFRVVVSAPRTRCSIGGLARFSWDRLASALPCGVAGAVSVALRSGARRKLAATLRSRTHPVTARREVGNRTQHLAVVSVPRRAFAATATALATDSWNRNNRRRGVRAGLQND